MLQMLITVGIVAGFFIAYGSSRLHGSLAWRILFIVEAPYGIVLVVGWYSEVAWTKQSLCFKHIGTLADVEEELLSIRGRLEEECTQQASFNELFAKRYIRRSILGIIIMAFMIFMTLCGVLHYADRYCTILCTNLPAQGGFPSQRASFLASDVSGIVNLLRTIPVQLWMDKWGRKFPLVGGGIAKTLCYLVSAPFMLYVVQKLTAKWIYCLLPVHAKTKENGPVEIEELFEKRMKLSESQRDTKSPRSTSLLPIGHRALTYLNS
ncbi:hypothetical protein EDC04DRAFT_2616292 [Pisolithus marmoratus]|nr:hypothetical protein EDC04DRAFT_2616292 [Pisolithus marmoratus]